MRKLCLNYQNEEILIQHILEVLALDLYMLQDDRNYSNLQFRVNSLTKFFDLALLYDFSDCRDCIINNKIWLNNFIIMLNDKNIRALINEYPLFSDDLIFFLEQGMSTTWEEICRDYHFNQDCEAYEQILSHYKRKEENQKSFLKKYTNNKL